MPSTVPRLDIAGAALLACGCGLQPQPRVERVVIQQNVEITLMDGGAAVDDSLPLVVGREALMRVFMTPGAANEALPLHAQLTFDDEVVAEADLELTRASEPGDLDSTLNVLVPGALMTAGEHRYGLTVSGWGFRQTWPAHGDGTLVVEPDHGPLEIVLVPIVADGFTPYTGPDAVSAYRERLLRLLPISDAEVRVREPYLFERPLCGDYDAINMLTTEILALRARDQAPARSYYYGLFAPAPTALDYLDECSPVLGLSLVVSNGLDTYARGSVGHGFFPDHSNLESEHTLVHEFGHGMGIRHAPCGSAAGTDSNYPHPSALIGRWAWDSSTGTLKNPLTHHDFMSYCEPAWVSDYNYPRLFGRIANLNATPDVVTATRHVYRSLWLDDQGAAHWLATAESEAPAGEAVPLEIEGGSGRSRSEAVGYRWSDGSGSLLLVRDDALRGATRLRLAGHEVVVPEAAR